MVARHRKPDQRRHRGAADQEAARLGRHAEQLPAPVDHLALDVDRAVVAAAEIGVHRRGHDLGEQAAGVPEPCTQPKKRGWVLPVG